MKKLIPLMLVTILFTFTLAQEEWWGNGVNIEHNGTLLWLNPGHEKWKRLWGN